MPTPTTTPVRASAFGCITIPFLLIALIPLAWGARSQWNQGQLARQGEVVAGRVVELRFVDTNTSSVQQSSRGGGARGESPVVTYMTRVGATRTVIGSVNRYPPPWVVGDTVDVVYDPGDPERADLLAAVEGWRLWFGIWCAVAILPAAIALVPVVLVMRQRPSHRVTAD